MAGSPRRLDSFFRYSTLSVTAARVTEQEHLLRLIREALPKSLGDHCLHCLRKNDTLTIQVGTAAQATMLRFQTSGLLEKIARQGGPLVMRWNPDRPATAWSAFRPAILPKGPMGVAERQGEWQNDSKMASKTRAASGLA